MSSSSWWPGRAGLAVVAGCAVAVPLVCAPPAQASPGTVAAPAPVVVGRAAWAYVTKSRPAQVNLNRSVAAPVGRDGRARTTYRSFFRLDLRPLAGRSPAKATLRIPAVFPARCGTRAPAVEIWETTGFDGRTSWNRQPQWRKRLAAVRPACADKRYTLDVSRLVADAVSARRAFLTLGLRAARENDPAAFARTGNRPTITVALKPPPVPPVPRPPAAPAEVAADPGGACASGPARPTIGTLRPTLSAKISDPDSRLVGARFEWRSLSGPVFGGQTTPMQASGTRLSVVVPDGALADGYGYAWRVQGLDGKASGPWSAWCEFTVGLPAALPDPEQPPARPGQPGRPRELGTGGNGWLGTCGQGAARSWIRELAPAFSATLDDPDYQPDDDGIYDPPVPLRATFEWVRLDGTKIGEKDVDGYARDRFRAWTPSGQFEDGQTYAWHVRASDETGPGPWSPWCEFTVDVTPPQTPPTVTSKEFPNDQAWHDRVGVTGTFTLNAGNDPDVVKFRYELDGRTATVPADRPGGTASITFTPTRGGPYFLRVYAVDRAGASGDPVTYEFRVSG